MTEFFRRHNLLITSVMLLALSLQLMSVSITNRALPQFGGRVVHAVIAPVAKVYHEAAESVQYLWRHYIALLDVETERSQLLVRVRSLESETSRLAELESENKRLRDLLNFSQSTALKGVAAAVIGRDASNWVRTITIDRGSNSGIRPGLAVVDGRAVIGQTIVVSARSAKVLLLTDNASAIAAIVQGSRAQGIAEGTLGKNLNLRYVMKEYPVQIGDSVVASGLDGIYPKGVLLGSVSAQRLDESGMFQSVTVQPSVDLNRLENVLVVLPDPQNEKPANGEQSGGKE